MFRLHNTNNTNTPRNQNNVIPFNFGRISRADEILQTQQTIDNAVFEMLNTVAQVHDWDIELIGDTRDAISEVLERHGIIEAEDFYPIPEAQELDTLSGFLHTINREVRNNPLGFLAICFMALIGVFILALLK